MYPRWESIPRLPACKASTLTTRPGPPLDEDYNVSQPILYLPHGIMGNIRFWGEVLVNRVITCQICEIMSHGSTLLDPSLPSFVRHTFHIMVWYEACTNTAKISKICFPKNYVFFMKFPVFVTYTGTKASNSFNGSNICCRHTEDIWLFCGGGWGGGAEDDLWQIYSIWNFESFSVCQQHSYYNVHEFSKKFSVFVTDAWSQFLMDRFETYKMSEAVTKTFFVKADKITDLSLKILATISPM